MFEGIVWYWYGDQIYVLELGDSLLFDVDVFYGLDELIVLLVKYLFIIIYLQVC